jgi:hypothetical protein
MRSGNPISLIFSAVKISLNAASEILFEKFFILSYKTFQLAMYLLII